MRKWLLWAALLAVGCNGKLSVGDGDGGGAGVAGTEAGGRSGAGGSPIHPSAGETHQFAGSAGESEGGSGATAGNGTAGNDPFPQGGCDCAAGSPAGGAGGSGGAAPGPGEIGENCVPGSLVTEADGSPAKAVIQTLDRCNEGLACNAQGKCVPAPDCPSSGLCVFRRAALGGSGGVGGAPGSTPPAVNGGAQGTAGSEVGGSGGNGPLFYATEKTGVVALTASESQVYWLEYGTRDGLGNYQHDGALMSYSTTDGTTAILASGLEGPVDLELTTSHAYVYIDGAPLIGSLTQPKLLRVPLAGGSAQLVQDGAQPSSFGAAGSQAFWSSWDGKVYSMLSDSNAVPTIFLTDGADNLTSDATDLYYVWGNALMRTPIASAAVTAVGVSADAFALHDDGIYTLESISTGGLLSRAAKSGGAFQRVRALGAGTPSGLRVVGDRYFLDVAAPQFWDGVYRRNRQVLTASFVGTDPPIRLLERNDRQTPVDHLWVGTTNALYWSEGQAIYKQPLPTP